MKRLILILTWILGLSACSPGTTSKIDNPIPTEYDFKCEATESEGVVFKYGYYKHVVDATAYNMGMRNFIMVEFQIGDRFNSIDINEDANSQELRSMYNEKMIYLNTAQGAYSGRTNFLINGEVDSNIIIEHLGILIQLESLSCK